MVKTPQLRICLTPKCNLRCPFCQAGGEGYAENLSELMTAMEVSDLIRICTDVGFTHVKFTGGEPLLREDMEQIVNNVRAIRSICEIQLVTNGSLLPLQARKLRKAGIDLLTVSIDATDPEEYRRIRGGDLKPVLQGLEVCTQIGLRVRINTVLFRSNVNQIEPLMSLAHKHGSSLKLLDLIDMPNPTSEEFFRREYLPFDEVRRFLFTLGGKHVGYEEAPGGIGAPLIDILMPSGLHVLLKDAAMGTCYHRSCYSCTNYPCEDALISLRVTHDGHLKRCLIRNDNIVDVLTPLRRGDLDYVRDMVKKSFNILTNVIYEPCRWRSPR